MAEDKEKSTPSPDGVKKLGPVAPEKVETKRDTSTGKGKDYKGSLGMSVVSKK